MALAPARGKDGGQMQSPAEPIHIAAACDESYAMPMATMLASVVANLHPLRRANVYVLETGLSAATKQKIAGDLPRDRIDVRWITVLAGRLGDLRGTLRSFDTVSLASYYRLLLPELLPKEVRKVIYLDCDLVVLHDLGALWDLDASATCLLAVGELAARSRFVSSSAGIPLYRELGLPPDLPFFNSGVMSINLERWRELLVMQRAIKYIGEAGMRLRWHDQEALNAVVAGDWIALDPRWNVTMHVFRESRNAALQALTRSPYIVHYNAAIKPWHHDFAYGFGQTFYQYVDATAWRGWRPGRPAHPTLSRWRARLVRAMRKRRQVALSRMDASKRALRGWFLLRWPLDSTEIPDTAGEVRVLMACDSLDSSTSALIRHYLSCGADRVLVATGSLTPGALESLGRSPERLHVLLPERAIPASQRLRQLLHRYGVGQWCLLVMKNELFMNPPGAPGSLRDLCTQMDRDGAEVLTCNVIDDSVGTDALDVSRADVALSLADQLPERPLIRSLLSDSISGRKFSAAFRVGVANEHSLVLDYRSRIGLLKYRPGMLIDRDLCGVQGARLARMEGGMVRKKSG